MSEVDVVARLKASERKKAERLADQASSVQAHTEAQVERGKELGHEWATRHATIEHLELLETDGKPPGFPMPLVAESIVMAAYIARSGTRSFAARGTGDYLTDSATGCDSKDPEFVRGFTEGALTVWRMAKPQL